MVVVILSKLIRSSFLLKMFFGGLPLCAAEGKKNLKKAYDPTAPIENRLVEIGDFGMLVMVGARPPLC